MNQNQPKANFYREYDLVAARRTSPQRQPQAHQSRAIVALDAWFDSRPFPDAGALLVLPTGGGKTFTAFRFICSTVISAGYKVLWLAHTHHLLEQAIDNLGKEVSRIAEPRSTLNARVVSGTPGHMPVHSIRAEDDVVIGTLQTIQSAYREQHPSLLSFLNSASDKLFIVFDEAHHSPAPSYRKLVIGLRERHPQLYLLGLTATPWYGNEEKSGWLKKLFPQGIRFQVSAAQLMADRILAKPISESESTSITPDFDEREYQKWLGSNRDIPEDLIEKLARKRERNAHIAQTYLKNREKYKKTIIFADRWYQCEFIREMLLKEGVRADAVYSHVDASVGNSEERNRRTSDENAKILDRFRNNELDVLLNVQMLTEGTDVPDVNTVFITRQTTSRIRMTQMVGRALRGPRMGGTEEAHLVYFIDNWQQAINWAEYSELEAGDLDESEREYGKRPPLSLISIELVRKLVRQMNSGINVESGPFNRLLPVGWYRIHYIAAVPNTEDTQRVPRLIMVFDNEEEQYRRFVGALMGMSLQQFSEEGVCLEDVLETVKSWQQQFFPDFAQHAATNLYEDLFDIARHVAQNESTPAFFPFEERDKHQLDALATEAYDRDWSPRAIDEALRAEYNRNDRYWATLYTPYELFKSQFDACLNRISELRRSGDSRLSGEIIFTTPESLPEREATEEVKRQVRERDGKCLCCGETKNLQVDHINPYYFGGSNILDNLQTLCATCNQAKGTRTFNFRDPQSDRTIAPPSLPPFPMPQAEEAGAIGQWDKFLRRIVNFFYECGAVHEIHIAEKGYGFYHWKIELGAGNNPSWLEPHLERLLEGIRMMKNDAGYGAPQSITVASPGTKEAAYTIGDQPKVDKETFLQIRKENSYPSKRSIIEQFTTPVLQDLITQYELSVEDARIKDNLIDVLSRARRAPIEDILVRLSMDYLRQLCRTFDVRAVGRSKAELIENMTGIRIEE